MSALDLLNKPITFGRTKNAAPVEPTVDAPVTDPPPSPAVAKAEPPRATLIALGGQPRANLLPPSVILAQRGRRAVRVMLAVVVAAAVIVVAGIAGSGWWALTQSAALAAERARTDQLLADQAQYADVNAAIAGLTKRTDAVALVGASDILWADYLALVRGTLPDGTALTGASIEATSPISAVTPDESALNRDRAASIVMTVSSQDLPAVQSLIDQLATLPGYTDAVLNSINLDPSGLYLATVSLGVDESVYSARFALEEDDE